MLAEYDQHARITGGDPEQMMGAAAAHYLVLTLDGTVLLWTRIFRRPELSRIRANERAVGGTFSPCALAPGMS